MNTGLCGGGKANAVIWTASAVGKGRLQDGKGRTAAGRVGVTPRCHPCEGPMGTASQGCSALLLPWNLQWGWGRARQAVKLPREKMPAPRGLENTLSARAHCCPPAMAPLQPLRPAAIGMGVIYGPTAGISHLPVLNFVWR